MSNENTKSSKKVISTKPSMKKKNCGICLKSALILIIVFLLTVILGGIFRENNAGNLVKIKEIPKTSLVDLRNGQEIMVVDGQTWIKVEGMPIEVIVLNDKNCGNSCDYHSVIANLKQGISPALAVRVLDITEAEGMKLVDDFEITAVPSFILGGGIEKLEKLGEKFVEQAAPILTKKDGLYLINSAMAGIKVGKFIKQPSFDLKNEPTLGNGKIKVIEFTDLQCPYCKRLHDNNKDSIKKLIEAGKITYIVKDFPLGFHNEAKKIHTIANCVQKNDGDKKYFEFVSQVFDNQQEWSGKADQELDFAKKYAESIGVELDEECIDDEDNSLEIEEDIKEGAKFGVSGTPALFIGTNIMPGAIDAETFEKAVNDEFAK